MLRNWNQRKVTDASISTLYTHVPMAETHAASSCAKKPIGVFLPAKQAKRGQSPARGNSSADAPDCISPVVWIHQNSGNVSVVTYCVNILGQLTPAKMCLT